MAKQTPPLPSCDDFDPKSLSVDQARERILQTVPVIRDIECLPIRSALNRVLAEEVHSSIDVPAHTNSAMDGYAILGSDIPSDGSKRLTVIGKVLAGAPLAATVKAGQCARIMTGGKMPAGTDTVIMQEHVTVDGDLISISSGHKVGQNVRAIGEDLAKGDSVFQPGRQLTPADIGMLASMGMAEVKVYRRPRVAFFSTGDELVGVGHPLGEGQIYDSNRYSLYGMLQRLGVEFIDMGIIPDQRDEIEAAFSSAANHADILITSGGVSVGEADFVKETLDKLGDIGFWKIAMKPGRPLAFGQLGQCQFFGLPGNPVSAMVTFYQFVQPAIKHMMGMPDVTPLLLSLKCETPLKKRAGRTEFQRGVMSVNQEGELVVHSTGSQGSGILSSMAKANCFIVLPLECERVAAGDMVQVQPFTGLI
jgi:molybdopterin molybdotransferase